MTQPFIHGDSALPDLDRLLEGVIATAGMHTRALDTLLTVSKVVWSTEIATACIECAERPRLLLNPDFVRRWCTTPERLTMLVLHELAHVMLGHTRLFPRPTALHNIAFDAIINRTVLDMLLLARAPVHRYAALLEAFYDDSRAPQFLLRPPPGWPHAPAWGAPSRRPDRLRRIHRALYSGAVSDAGVLGVTYGEIIEALREEEPDCGADAALLGAHGSTPLEEELLAGGRDVVAAEVLSGQLDVLRGLLPGGAAALNTPQVRAAARVPALERALRELLRTAAHARYGASRPFEWVSRPIAVVHRMHDRRAAGRVHAARMLGAPHPMLFAGQALDRRPQPTGVTIYVDVSGSMNGVLPHLRRALQALHAEIAPTLYWFSTKVVPATALHLETGRIPTTGGTSVTAVLRHAVATVTHGTPIVMLTDGYLEAVTPAVSRAFTAHGTPLRIGVLGPGPLHDREAWVTSAVRLPSPTGS